jgi:hypothetical protein
LDPILDPRELRQDAAKNHAFERTHVTDIVPR